MTKHQNPVVTVLGSGSWGTALAILLARNGHKTHLWGIEKDYLKEVAQTRVSHRYLPDIHFPEQLSIYYDLDQSLDGVDNILIAVPSFAFRELVETLSQRLPEGTGIFWATKGIEPKSGQFFHQIITEKLGASHPLAIISGPSFAIEVAKGLPTAVSLASHSSSYAKKISALLSNQNFKVDINDDLIGTQLAGAAKNVLAIASGLSDGLGMGSNTRAALLTHGLAEVSRLGIKMGAQQTTFLGLAGVGDLILTGTDNQSRNYRLGLYLGKGMSLEQAQAKVQQVVEGVYSAEKIVHLAASYQIKLPIMSAVYALLTQQLAPAEAVSAGFV